MGLGAKSQLRVMGVDVSTRTRAQGGATRRGVGAGKVRRIGCLDLWMQTRVEGGAITSKKVTGELSIADTLTEHLDRRC